MDDQHCLPDSAIETNVPLPPARSLAVAARDLSTDVDVLQRRVRDALDSGALLLTLDLAECAVADSRGLRLLVETWLTLSRRGGRLKLARAPEPLLRLLHSARLDALLA